MKNTRHPAFLTGILALILFFIGLALKSNGYRSGDMVFLGGVVVAAIMWIWSIITVVGRSDMKPFQKRFWLIAVIAAPVFGGLLFFVLHQRKDRLTT